MQPRGPAAPPAGGGRGPNLAQLGQHKGLLAAGGAVVAVAVYAWVKHRGSSSATSTAGIADGSTLAGTPGNPAALNSVGTDVASQLGQFGADQQQALQAWLAQLTSTLDAAKQLPAESPAGGPSPTMDLSPRGRTVSVGTGVNAYDFARGVYGNALGINTLRQLNPGFDSWIKWGQPDSQGNLQPFFIKGRPVKT